MISLVAHTLFVIGAFGFLGLSVLCPLLAIPVYCVHRLIARKREPTDGHDSNFPSRIEILIPTFNEAGAIGGTLTSLAGSIQYLRDHPTGHPAPDIRIRVAADGCTDQTASIARTFPLVTVSESPVNRTKWVTLKDLILESAADWVFLVDAGTLWPEDLLAVAIRQIEKDRNTIAIAPSCWPPMAGVFHHVIWDIETTLKRLETLCGGPISLHGPTVAYKTAPLQEVMRELGETRWMNDDVVIPLMLRTLCPEGMIHYPVGKVSDGGFKPYEVDLGRRNRMLQGNLQWAGALLPHCFRINPVAGLVAVRRIFRMVWAYWIACAVFALALTFHILILPGIAALSALIILSGSFRQIAGAAWISFLAPFRLARSDWRQEVAWK
jgi:glycosyltransferase involved in cell wall biosynthesis